MYKLILRPECMPIGVDANDELGITCMEFVRSAPAAAVKLSGMYNFISIWCLMCSIE